MRLPYNLHFSYDSILHYFWVILRCHVNLLYLYLVSPYWVTTLEFFEDSQHQQIGIHEVNVQCIYL